MHNSDKRSSATWQNQNNGRPISPLRKFNRRPVPPNGKTVASLQQQWLAAQQEHQQPSYGFSSSGSVRSNASSAGSYRSVSPLPIRSRLAFEPGNEDSEEEGEEDEQEQQEEEVNRQGKRPIIDIDGCRRSLQHKQKVHDGIHENDEVEDDGQAEASEAAQEESYDHIGMTLNGNQDDQQSDRSSFMSSPSVITLPGQPTHYTSSQEFKVAREGWLYKKNSLMQWRQVYAVAKHGNAVKPGALYLYKDDKFANHIHTYDMSEVVEVEPRTQDYRAGIKWEFRLLVKRDDVVLATDDATLRKDWISSLTSIMGKVSLATHSELQSRTMSVEQMNRQLQSTNTSLEQELAQLRQDNSRLSQEMAEAQKRERSLSSEHTARESGLMTELEHVRQNVEEIERELGVWRSKADELEKQKMHWQAKAQDWQAQAHEWRDQVAVLEDEKEHLLDEKEMLMEEKEQLLDDKENQYRMMSAATTYHNTSHSSYNNNNNNNGRGIPQSGRRNNTNGNKLMMEDDISNGMNQADSMRDVRYQLQSLRDQVKDPLLQSHVVDIKTSVTKLVDTFEEARRGWTELQNDIVKLLEAEGDDRAHLLESVQSGFASLQSVHTMMSQDSKLESILTDLQASQTTLLEMLMNKDQTTMERALNEWQEKQQSQYKQMMEQQQQWLNDTQTKVLEHMATSSNNSGNNDSSGGGSEGELTRTEIIPDAKQQQKYLLSVLEGHLNTLKQGQDRGREEYDKSFKVLGQLFQHVIQQLDDNVVPDVSQHLDELADRLATIDERLHRIQLYRSDGSGDNEEMRNIGHSLDDEDVRELVIGTRGFMERTLRVLDRFGGSQSGMEETVRRAVKSAFNSHLDVNWKDPQQNEEKLKRYEENAREYIDKSMLGMRGHLEDYTGVMYKMIEDLILRAVQHLDNNGNNSHNNEDGDSSLKNQKEEADRLAADIGRLKKERDDLESLIKQLGKENNDYTLELFKKKAELQSSKAEYDRVQRQIQQARHDGLSAMARDLEPLVRQINKLKQSVRVGEDSCSDDSEHSGGYVDLGSTRPTSKSFRSIENQRNSHTARDRAAASTGATPLSNFLNRK